MKLLNSDIIRNIILYIKDDKASLFRCLLVNKTWWSQTIDILWSQPFRLLYSCISKLEDSPTCNCKFLTRRRQASSLINIYITFIILENEQDLIDNNIIKQGQILNPMHNYIDFLRNIDIHEFDLAIIDFYNFYEINFNEKIQNDNDIDPIIPKNFFEEITSDYHTTNESETNVTNATNTTNTMNETNETNETNTTNETNETNVTNAINETNETNETNTTNTTNVTNVTNVTNATTNATNVTNETNETTQSDQSTSTEIIEKLDYSEIIKYLADPKVLMELRNTISQYQIISEIILNFFMRKCKNNLRRLSFDVNQIYHKSIFNPCKDYQRYSTALSLYKRGVRDNPEYKVAEIYLSLPKYFNAINCLSNIRELICTTKRNMSNFFLSLSKYVHNLDKLEINIDHSVEANYLNWLLSRESSFLREEVANLIKLIHKQKNLSHFILHNCPVDFSLVMEELKESHAKNLKSLSLIGIKFEDQKIFFHLGAFSSLQKLLLYNCNFNNNNNNNNNNNLNNNDNDNDIYNDNNFDFIIKEKIYLPNLKKIDLNNSFIPHQFLQYLLQICSSNLKYLDIGKRYSKYSLIGSNFNPIQFISTNFSNIKFLKCDLLPFENNHFISLLSYNSYYIQSIILDNYEENNNFAKCLSILSEINFDNLKYFGIRGNFIFSEFTLSKFLVNNIRKNRGLNLHVLEFTKNIWFDNDYLKEILKCLDNGFTCNKLIITTIGEIKPELLAKAREKIKVVQCVEMRVLIKIYKGLARNFLRGLPQSAAPGSSPMSSD
ncbi:unnamed protein product [Rhizophagus irregularis]|nr:unnamed protein product [Rhizophagus irregularis]